MMRRKSATVFLLAFCALVGLGGCSRSRLPTRGTEVVALPNRQVVELNSDDVVKVMLRSGFPDEAVLELGTDLRNALAVQGSARIRIGKRTEALFAVVGDYLHVSSRTRGSFIYDLEKQCCR
jgi:hypothetical protein